MAYTPPTVVASGATFAQFQAGGASGHLDLLIAQQAATLAPTVAATASATGGGASGGAIAAGTYYIVITESNGFGETTAGPESAQLTVSATNIPRVTFQALKTGNTSRNVYLGAVNGTTGGPYYLYSTGTTASTKDLTIAVPTGAFAVQPPTVNTTGPPLSIVRACKKGNLEEVYRNLRQLIDEFNRGEAIVFSHALNRLRTYQAAFSLLNTLCTEMGTLIDANPGTIGTTALPIGTRKDVRTWS